MANLRTLTVLVVGLELEPGESELLPQAGGLMPYLKKQHEAPKE